MAPPREIRLARLRGLMKLLVLIGLAFALFPFLASLLPPAGDPAGRRAAWELQLDLRDLAPAAVRRLEGWPGGPVWIYRRRPAEWQALGDSTAPLLDPDSQQSEQPEGLTGPYRSHHKEFFVFVPLESQRQCQVRLVEAQAGLPKGFEDPCLGTRFDLAGRVLRGTELGARNLTVPPHRFPQPAVLRMEVWTR